MARVMFIGRWQVPELHDGHKTLIQTAIDKGHTPIIAIRNTPISNNNPYTAWERSKMFRDYYGSEIEVVVIPDIDEVWVGREVGYNVVSLSEDLENLSGTKVRDMLRKTDTV